MPNFGHIALNQVGGYTASVTEFSDGGEDYCGRIDLTNKVMTNEA